jgi:hypothetical protein
MIKGRRVRLPSELNRQSDESDQSDYCAVANVLMYLTLPRRKAIRTE